jgi:hypothetical protein
MHRVKVRIVLLCMVTLIGLWAIPMVLAAEQPRRGGILQVALAGDPPQPGHAPRANLHGGSAAGPRVQQLRCTRG